MATSKFSDFSMSWELDHFLAEVRDLVGKEELSEAVVLHADLYLSRNWEPGVSARTYAEAFVGDGYV